MIRMIWLPRIRERLFRSKLYNLTLQAGSKKPDNHLPILFKGDAEYGRVIRVGDLINSVKLTSLHSTEKEKNARIANHVHRFRWLADMDASGLDTSVTVARELIALWIEVHGRWDSLSWSVEVISERLSVWLLYEPFLMTGSDQIFQDAFYASVHRQARHLLRARALGVREGDGFASVKAKIFYNIMFNGQVAQLTAGQDSLARQIDVEILPDGGHRTRNPSQHLKALRNLIEIRVALTEAGHGTPIWLQKAIDRMTPMLRMFRLGDGRLCLFNGAGSTTSEEVTQVLQFADAKGRAIVNAPHIAKHL